MNKTLFNELSIFFLLTVSKLSSTFINISPFLAVIVIGAYFAGIGDDLFNTSLFVLTIFGILIAHLGINVFNDYFDVKDGTDEENAEYFQQVSGGSRAIELGLISLAGTRKLAIILTLIALAIGAYILTNVNPANMDGVWQILVAGLLLGYFYTARPLRLVARRGLGEIAIFLAFGPLLTLGTGFAIFNGDFGNSEHFLNCMLIGIPMGLLTTNILLINEFPDMKSDAKTGKNHLVVTFGKKASRWIYLLFLTLAVASSFYMYQTIANQYLLIPTIFCLLFGLYIFRHILKHYEMRSLVDANWKTIGLQALYSILLCICLLFGF